MTDPLPPYTIAVQRFPWVRAGQEKEVIAVKRIDGRWDLVGGDQYWFNNDEELYEQWPEVEIIGLGIWSPPHSVECTCVVCDGTYNTGREWDDRVYCAACYHQRYGCPSWCQWSDCPGD